MKTHSWSFRQMALLLAAAVLCFSACQKPQPNQQEEPKLNQQQSGEPTTLAGHSSWVRCVTFSRDGNYLASGSADHSVKLWDAATGKELATFKGDNFPGWSVAFTPDGKTLAAVGFAQGIKLWDVASKEELPFVNTQEYGDYLAFSPDGKTLGVARSNGDVFLLDFSTKKERPASKGLVTERAKCVAFSPDGTTLAVGGKDKGEVSHYHAVVKLLDSSARKDRVLFKDKVWDRSLDALAFSPDGKTLAAVLDSEIKIWDIASGKELHTLGGVYAIAFSPDGKTLASATLGNAVLLYEVATGNEVSAFPKFENGVPKFRHDGPIHSIAFSSDGKKLATASGDKTIKLWDMPAEKTKGN
ncbi:hypothetical protein AYO44_06905 [Planctomycetaceae bacterium SCGC AG-212-F19]|nr:hypothetical protein AYO44_06905 [Planctomycetaceae bacterium SCGC AG-212-F19]